MESDFVIILNALILLLLLVTAVASIWAHNLIISTIFLSMFSLLMAGQYLVLGAPDVAITEAAVGAGISTVLLLLALFLVGNEERYLPANQIVPGVLIAITLVALIYASFFLPPFGDVMNPVHMHIAPYYLEGTGQDIGIPSVVAAILASYRGYDTLGETVVIFTAAIGVLLLLKPEKEKRK